MGLGEGKTGVFKIRQKELDAADYGQTILDETRKLNVGLGISVQQLVDGVRTETDASTWQARQEISLATTVMQALGAAIPDRIGAVRLALCRPQHPAADRQSAALDAAAVQRRSRDRNLSLEPARRDRGDGQFAGGVPRKHDRGPRAERRPGQGPHRQGRARLPHGSPDRRIRGHRPRRARHPADLGQFDADHGAEPCR